MYQDCPLKGSRSILCGGSTRKNYKKFFDKDSRTGKYIISTTTFIDSKNPVEVSVNRVSTISTKEAHQLGLDHKKDRNITASYNGYAKVKTYTCRNATANVIKDDYNGAKPYHANIVYPRSQSKADDMEIANQIAMQAEMVIYTDS